MRKLKLREVKCPLQGHRANKDKAGLDLRPSDSSLMLSHHDSQAIIVSSAMSYGTSPEASVYPHQGDSCLKHMIWSGSSAPRENPVHNRSKHCS